MSKKILEKEEIIIQQKIELNAEVDQKAALKQRLNETQKLLSELKNENLSLKQHTEQFKMDLHKKSKDMEELKATISELNEIIAESQKKMDESIEYIMNSSVTNQSSGNDLSGNSTGSPENMAKVIDVQLREQKTINLNLSDKIESLNSTCEQINIQLIEQQMENQKLLKIQQDLQVM